MIVTDKDIVGPWVFNHMGKPWDGFGAQAIGLMFGARMVAGVTYHNWNGRSVVCHISINGIMTPTFLAAIFHYPFVHLGAQKIIAPITEINDDSIRLVTKMGFRKEAQLLDAHPDGSILFYTMNKEDCRFIGDRYVKRLRIIH